MCAMATATDFSCTNGTAVTDLGGGYAIDSSNYDESFGSSVQATGYFVRLFEVSAAGYFTQQSSGLPLFAVPVPFPGTRNTALSPSGIVRTITIATNPSGLGITVDGVALTAPQQYQWTPSNAHTIATTSPQSGPAGTRYSFLNWSNGGSISQTVVAPDFDRTYLASFTTEHELTTSVQPTGGGTITAGGWFSAGAQVSIVATPQPGYTFTGFSGHLTGAASPQTIQMNGPRSVVANFAPIGNTGTGSGVVINPSVTLPGGTSATVSLTFDSVQGAGNTTVTASAQGPAPSAGFKLGDPPVFYEISTTATFTGSVRVCLRWAEGQIFNEAQVGIFHYENGAWVNITDESSRNVTMNQVCGSTASLSTFALMEAKHTFAGFFQPVDNLPTQNAVKAGAAVPVKFRLGGNLGLNIFAAGYPKTQIIQCSTGELVDSIEETATAGSSGLSYDAATDQYTYVWKTDKSWAGSCRELQVKLNDGETYRARFTLRK
jgi:hypothetical protein